MRKRRHWFRGIIGGLLTGLGLAIGSIVYSFNALGPMTPWILIIVGVLLGIVLVMVPRPWGRRKRPAPAAEVAPAQASPGS